MIPETEQDALTELDDLLDAERAALLKGNLQELTNMLTSKESLMSAMVDFVSMDRPQFERLDAKVRRNQLLLDGALDGIRHVVRRMAHLRETTGVIATYGADGQKKMIGVDEQRSIERRA